MNKHPHPASPPLRDCIAMERLRREAVGLQSLVGAPVSHCKEPLATKQSQAKH